MRLLLVTLLLALGACATIPRDAPAYHRASEPQPGYSNIYIYRVGAQPYLREVTVRIGEQLTARPAEGAYTVASVRSGSHRVQVNWPWDVMMPNVDDQIDIPEGLSIYLRVSASLGFGYGSQSVTVIEAVPPTVAERELAACCRYVAPVSEP